MGNLCGRAGRSVRRRRDAVVTGIMDTSASISNVTVDLDEPVQNAPQHANRRCLELCRSQKLFTGMLPDDLSRLAAGCKFKRFQRSKVIVCQGQSVTRKSCLYMIASGTVTVHVYGARPFDFELGPGDMFGEVAVLFGLTRNATIVSKQADTWALSHYALKPLIHTIPHARTAIFLRKQLLLQNLSDFEVMDLVGRVEQRNFPAGALLTREGEPGHEMYIIRRGHVAVHVGGQLVATMRRGDVVGQRALQGRPRTATCKSLEDCMTIAISQDLVDGMKAPLRRILCCDAVIAVHQHGRVFGSVDQEQLQSLLATIEERVYKQGQHILHQDEPMNDIFVVRDGTVEGFGVTSAGGFQYFGSIAGQPSVSDIVVSTAEASVVKCSRERCLGILDGCMAARQVSMAQLNILHEIGNGCSGTVRYARDSADPKKEYAVKSIRKNSRSYDTALREAAVMQKLNNNFCVRLFGVSEDELHVHLIMELVTGGDLFRQLQLHFKLPVGTVRFYFGCVLLALEYLHRNGFVYRDLKPENLLLDAKGYLKVTDFGFAKHIGNKRTHTVCGTPEYQAPEIADRGATVHSDFWSLGVLLYELLTGLSPFRDKKESVLVILRNAQAGRYVPPNGYEHHVVHDLLKQLLQPDPDVRLCNPARIQAHPWFDGFDWKSLARGTLPAPFKPNTKHIRKG